jgi:hypothetical protein
MNNFKKEIIQKLKTLKVKHKLVPSDDWDDLILYPDNYDNDNVWFCLYRFYDIGKSEVLAEDCNGNFYGQYTEDEFLDFVKSYEVK